MKHAFRMVLLIAASVGVSLGVAEGVLALVSAHSPRLTALLEYGGHDGGRWDGVPDIQALLAKRNFPHRPYANWNGFVINSRGFRTPEYSVEKAADTLRVVAIGDSFTFDSGVVPYPYHFTVRLEQKLTDFERSRGRSVEMINLGQPSIGPGVEQLIFDLEASKLRPDLVLWQFFVGNDFDDAYPTSLLEESEKTRARAGPQFPANLRIVRLIERLARLRDVAHAPPDAAPARAETAAGTYVGSLAAYDPSAPTFTGAAYLRIQRSRLGVYDEATFPYQNWDAIRRTFVHVRDACRRAGCALLVIVVPDENQVNPHLLRKVVSRRGREAPSLDMELPQRKLAEFLDREGIAYLDLLPAFREGTQAGRLYTPNDSHWNAEGNRLAAERIFDRLIERELLPR